MESLFIFIFGVDGCDFIEVYIILEWVWICVFVI